MTLAPLLLALAPVPVPVPAQDAAGRVIERRFSSEVELVTERFEVVGTEAEASETKRIPAQVREQADEVVIVDTYPPEGDGDEGEPPPSFVRLYATLETTFDVGRRRSPQSKTASASLAGKTVRFERERDGTYARHCDDPEARPVQLRRLRADLSLAPFLPPPPEESGAAPETWEVPNAELGRLFSPVESEVRRPRPKDEAPEKGLSLSPSALRVPIGVLLAEPTGSLRATRLADEEDEELPCRARLEFRLSGSHDGSAALLAGPGGEREDELELTYHGQGTLAWDPASGAIEIELEGEARLEESFRLEVSGNGATAEMTGELVMSGSLAFEGRERPGE